MQVKKGIYKNFKGNLYEVVDEARHSETLEPLIVYRALYGEKGLWVRPKTTFFETIEDKGITKERFSFIGESQKALEAEVKK